MHHVTAFAFAAVASATFIGMPVRAASWPDDRAKFSHETYSADAVAFRTLTEARIGASGGSMVELAFTACLSADPQTCREEVLIFLDMPLRACTVRGQIELARWGAHHSGWTVRRWTCRRPDPDEADI